MVKVVYKGGDVNLGRFGAVKKNDALLLTDQEWQHVTADPRFELLPEGKKPPKAGLIPITDKMTPSEREAAEKANAAESKRLESLGKANDSDQVEILEIKNKSFEDLQAMAEAINEGERRQVIDIARISKPDLLRKIIAFRREKLGRGALAGHNEE